MTRTMAMLRVVAVVSANVATMSMVMLTMRILIVVITTMMDQPMASMWASMATVGSMGGSPPTVVQIGGMIRSGIIVMSEVVLANMFMTTWEGVKA